MASGEVPPPPAGALLGWKVLEALPGSGRARVQFEASNSFTNGLGGVQGGFLAAMLDYTLSSALATTYAADEMGPTIEMKVNFLRPADLGSFVGEGRVVQRGCRGRIPRGFTICGRWRHRCDGDDDLAPHQDF